MAPAPFGRRFEIISVRTYDGGIRASRPAYAGQGEVGGDFRPALYHLRAHRSYFAGWTQMRVGAQISLMATSA